jgi:1,4-alpha-glucan branching enzyme
MDFKYAISFVLDAHIPFVRDFRKEDDLSQTGEESRFFESISQTFLPLLGVFDRLENDHIPFHMGIVISPILFSMLSDEHLQNKYMHYTDSQIEFGKQEIERTAEMGEIKKLAEFFNDQLLERRIAYTERYKKNILKAFDYYRRKGKIEILASSATNAFLPFISYNPESMQAQMEIPISGYRKYFGGSPAGFWLPELGWTSAIEQYLRSYNFTYTIVDSHGLLYGKPAPQKGSFFPVKTPSGTFILARDYYAARVIEQLKDDEVYLDNDRDVGYELPKETLKLFLNSDGERRRTGFKYWARSLRNISSNGRDLLYNPQTASDKATEHARLYLENTIARLEEAAKHMEEAPISLYVQPADHFGRLWYEGPQFIEALFRLSSGYRGLQFLNPSDYIFSQKLTNLQVVTPEFSSWGINGYAETWLDTSNDWIYRHLSRSMDRMTELAERFPDDTGLKERALNQAAREILLAQSADWPGLLHKQDSTEFARHQAEISLRNFTTIYEALGSNYISTEWLTTLERKHNIFPNINYRVFRRKK